MLKHHPKKASNIFSKAILLVVILILGCFIAMSAAVTEVGAPTQALTSTEVTMLSTNNGLVYGDNHLRLTNVQSFTLQGSSASEGSQRDTSVTQTDPHDLYISGNISVNKGKGGFLGSAGYSNNAYIRNEGNDLVFASYPKTLDTNLAMTTRIGMSPSLKAAIEDPMLTVTANAYFTASAVDSSADYCDVTITWMPTGNPSDSNNTSKTLSSAVLNSTRNTGTIVLDRIGANAALKLDLNNFRQAQLAYGESGGWFGSGDDYVSSAIAARFSQIYIKIDITMNNGLQFRTAASNFGDITIIDGPNRNPNCAKDFLKPMDVFEIRTNLRYQNENLIMSYNGDSADKFFVTMEEQEITVKNEFRDFFFKPGGGADLMQVSTIEWNFDPMYLERIIDENFDITGQVARFRVLDIPPGVITPIELQPFLRRFEEGYSIGLNRIGPKITLRGDASAPEDPQINENDPFLMDYFNQGKWYSKGFQEGTPETRGVYIKVQMSPASFITGNGSAQRMYYTTDGQNPITAINRRILVDNITSNSTNREVTLFFPMSGSERQRIYTLRIVAYDYVGNISSIVTYSNIKLDCTDYSIEVFFMLGDRLSAAANSSAVSMLGTSELGTYKSETDKDFKKTASRTYRRGDLVYIQLSVKKSSQYRLFQYYNSGKRAYVCTYVDYGDFAAGNYGHFTEKTNNEVKLSVPDFSQQVAIVLDDEFLEDMENLKFYFIFKQQLPITIGATEAVYDGTPKGIEQPTTTYSGIEILTYYKATEEEPFVSQVQFTDAGSYFYRCEIVDINYFGYAGGNFVIRKADPFVTGLEVQSIYYENSMGSATIRCANTDPDKPDMLYTSASSSDGKVAGSFSIVYPVNTTQAYIRPTVGTKDIIVTFTPTEQYSKNYNVMTYNSTLFVHYSTNLTISFVESTFTYTYQKDVVRYASAITNPGNQQIIYEYKRQGQPDTAYTAKAPTDAGVYEVRVRTDLTISNYDNQKTTEGTDLKFIINRQPVLVVPTPAVCYYQNDYNPIAEAYITTPSGNQFIPISEWRYEYLVNNQWVDMRPTDSGVYQVKVIVDSQNEYGEITGNYSGEALTTLTIKKGNADEANGENYHIEFPTPINNPSIRGHIAYGQKLSEINLTKSDGYVATYMYRVTNQQGVETKEKRVVAGEFIVATRLYNPAVETVAAFVAEMKNTILPAGRYTGSTVLYTTFVPEDLINFNIATWRANITVVAGTPTFNNLQVSQLTYGQIAAELTINGFTKIPGDAPVYVISEEVRIDGVLINPTVNGLPVTGRLVYIDSKDKQMRAGTQSVVFRFIPDDTANVVTVSALNISVIVNKAPARLETADAVDGVITKTYGNVFRNPTVTIYKRINTPDGYVEVVDNSFNVTFTYRNSQGQIVTMNAFTPAGQYTMTAEIDNADYQGSLEQQLIIQKAKPALNTAPIASTVKYMMDMSGVTLTGGRMQHPVTYQQVNGIFVFKDDVIPPPPNAVGDRQYDVTFRPIDSDNYEETDIKITINIKKATASITLSNLQHIYSGMVKEPTYSTNIVIRTDGDTWYYVDLDLPENELTEFDRPLSVDISFNTPNNNVPINAGRYQVTARINDANYEGMAQAEYVIEQADATIVVDQTSRVQAYNSGTISLKASAKDLAGNTIKVLIAQSFSTIANVALSDAPRDVGIYNVTLEIRDTNYKAKTFSTLTITISQLNILNNIQTYGTRPPVLVEYMPSTASSVIRYQQVFDDELGDITDVQPTSAGMYKILISFPANLNNGYTADFESTLIINKAQVSLSYNGSFKYTYTGLPRSQLIMDINSVRVTPSALYALKRTVLFFDAEIEEFTSVEPVDVGSYIMVVSIDDNNYAGSEQFTYIIEKATPVIRINPAVSPLTYRDDGSQAIFDGGEVVFNGEIKAGCYQLVENTMNLEVGIHSVMYRFIPDDSHNLKEIHGTAQVTIVQKDLSSAIVFYGATTVQYNQQPHYINAYIDSGENVIIDIFYNRSKSAPRERGEYVITAEIADKNYKGSAEWENKLTIIVGMPEISPPKLTDIRLNDPLGYSEIQGGFAYINGTGEFVNNQLVPGTATLIAGTFAFTRPSTIMDKANYREVELSFKPFASNNFSNVIFTTTVRVIGLDPVIGTVVSSKKEADKTIYYGQDLSNYNLSFETTPPGATPGVLSFVDESIVPQVGKPVKYRFYPDNDTLYNIVEGDVDIAISKTTPSVQSVSVRAFYGQTLRQAIFNALMLNPHNSAIAVDGQFSLIEVEGFEDLDTVLTVANTVSMTGMSTLSSTPTLQGRYRFVSDNYNTVEGDVAISCYNLVDDANIDVARNQKRYDALPISVSDLGVSTAFTQHPLFEENYLLTIFSAAGVASQGIEVGVYTVIIEIIDVMYYGKKEVTFTIDKADISADISLSHTSGVFGEAIAKPTVIVSGNYGDIPQQNFVIEFKGANEDISGYNETMPSQAGIYDVRITVTNNAHFAGQKLLTFIIEKRAAAVTVSGMIQNYGNVNPLVAQYVEYDLVPTITYYSPTYNRSTIVPTEAGDYTARIEIIHNNYTIRAGNHNYIEVSFKIIQANLTLREKPTVSDIVYGQSYSDARINGGRVTYGESLEVQGKYSFMSPSEKPDAGRQTVDLLFTPYNKNYAVLRIDDVDVTVLRANVEILFTNLMAVYDGTNKKNAATYVSDSQIEWEIVFIRQGIEVEPINAGSYEIRVRVLSNNHQLGIDISGAPILEKPGAATFIINKASMSDFTLPVPTEISYGQSLAFSTLNSSEYEGYGIAQYEGISGNVSGSFSYVNSGLVLGDAGSYIVDIVFNPTDSANYNIFYTKIEVNVAPARATISVRNNTYTYGTPITLPIFITNPGNLTVSHDMDCIGQIKDAGVYKYTVWVTSRNYDHPENYFEFNIEVLKKAVRIEFVQNGQRIDKYYTTYNKLLNATAVVNTDDIVPSDLYSSLGVHINQRININYYSIPKSDGDGVTDYGHVPPVNIGDYRVTATMDHPNYYGDAIINYDINLGEIEEIKFDTATLERQVYGSVVPPIITTKPAGVSYWIDYQGHGKTIPPNAGTYNIVVYFNDPNYVPKHISAMFKIQKKEITLENIEVQNKAYDGVSTIAITAKMNGVLPGSEVKLDLKARTLGGATNVGIHNVEILSYNISGLSAQNYYVAKPYFAGTVEIFEKKIIDINSQSFITSKEGFTEGLTVEFKEIDSASNKENFFTNMLGQKATVQTFVIKENGAPTTLDTRVKVYLKIPDEYLDVENLKVYGLGKLGDRQINFIREGDYYTFYTDSSGEVVFTSNDFSYWFIPVTGLAVIIVLGVFTLFWLNPRRRKSATGDTAGWKRATKKIRKGGLYRRD